MGEKTRARGLDRQFRGTHQVRQQGARVLLAHRDPDRRGRDARLSQRLVREFRVAGEGGAEDDRVDLAERDLQPERGFQAVEESLECIATDPRTDRCLEVEREQRRWQSEEHVALAQREILVTLDRRAADVDGGMPRQ